jgi:predicted negative regulator of RcsB-dependent stress response
VKRSLTLAVLATAVGACAYYNGLYNANHLAKEARRAERQGRTGEARSLWSQAAVKAESVASRHPHSKYRDDALLLQGTALQRLRSCVTAVGPLELAADSSPDRTIRVEAALRAGECRLDLLEPDSALEAVALVLSEGSAQERSQAQLIRGQAFLRLGRTHEAIDELTASAAPTAVFPKAMALARMGRAEEGAAVLRAAVTDPFVEDLWIPALDTVGRAVPAEIAPLIDALTARSDVGLGQRLRLWLADGQRWLQFGDTARAVGRFAQVRSAGPDSTSGRSAWAYLGLLATLQAHSWSDVPVLADSLSAAIRQGGEPVRIAGRYVSVLNRARAGLQQDALPLELFLAAEDVRDSLKNPLLASSLFEQVVQRFPTTPLAPKALLVLATLHPTVADSLIGVLRERYPTSPYTLILSGQGNKAYEVLEDSLRRAAAEAGRRRSRGENPRPEEASRRNVP